MPTSTFRTADGAQIAYDVLGTRTAHLPIVLINGMSAIMEDWAELAAALGETRQVVVFDHRGIGASHLAGDEAYTIELLADDVLALLQHLGLTRVQLLGFSMGGLVTQAMVAHPAAHASADGAGVVVRGIEVRAIVLTATFAKMPKSDFNLKKQPSTDGMSGAERARALAAFMLRYQYDEASLASNGALAARLQARIDASVGTRRPQVVILQQMGAMAQYDAREALRRVPRGLPVLLVHGRSDRMVDYGESRELEACLPQAQRYVPRDGEAYGHMWFDYYDLRSAWVRPLAAFLEAGRARL
ncbi:hypothetical protein MBRA1_002309 [Malassezia brasiliensis]|uniref:AB hydrolase-1 domain-containing protein n=1 Tax=Malassezia brasiliensis TaxID=1821822 RepID=A0AAF0IQ52_9BASI|nr:hypothetical protein MBRA1_002309 [Malassezia brasiliensis]